jgi:hypothetical protein
MLKPFQHPNSTQHLTITKLTNNFKITKITNKPKEKTKGKILPFHPSPFPLSPSHVL